MKKLYLIVFVLLASPFFQAKADVLLRQEEDKYSYEKEVCNVINNFDEVLNNYTFYYINSSPMSKSFALNTLDSEELSKISMCLDIHRGGMYGDDLVLVDNKDKNLVLQYNKSLKNQEASNQRNLWNSLKNSNDFVIFLNKSSLEFSRAISVDKNLFTKQPEDVYEANFYNLNIDANNKAVFTKKSGADVKKGGNKELENIAITVVITSFISIIVLLVIQRKLNKKVNE